METKQYSIEVGGCLEDGWIVLFEGFFHAEFRDEQDAKEYIEFKNNKAVQKAKIDVIISWIRKSDCDPDYLIKMLEDLKNGK